MAGCVIIGHFEVFGDLFVWHMGDGEDKSKADLIVKQEYYRHIDISSKQCRDAEGCVIQVLMSGEPREI